MNTNKQIIKEYHKTTKVIADFKKAVETFKNHKNVTNDFEYNRIFNQMKEYFEEDEHNKDSF